MLFTASVALVAQDFSPPAYRLISARPRSSVPERAAFSHAKGDKDGIALKLLKAFNGNAEGLTKDFGSNLRANSKLPTDRLAYLSV